VKKVKNSRRKVNYQNQFIYTSPDALDSHFNNGSINDPDNTLRNNYWSKPDGNAIRQLHRVQSLNYGFSINHIDLNQYGQLGRFDSAVIDTPDISLEMEYLLSDGYNERALDFIIDGQSPALSKYIVNDFPYGKNFFIGVGPDGYDLIGKNLHEQESEMSVVGIGNCFLNQYAVSAEVGSLPKARAVYEGFNIRSYKGVSNLPLPSIIPTESCYDPNMYFSLPDTYDSFTYPQASQNIINEIEFQKSSRGVLPGGIKVSIDDGGLLAQQTSSDFILGKGAAHIQGFSFNIPFSTTRINRLGSNFEFARVYNFPSSIEITFTALVSEFKNSNLFKYLCSDRTHNLVISMHDFCSVSANRQCLSQEDAHVSFYFKNALLDSESLSQSIGDAGRTVDVSFSLPISDPTLSQHEGFYMFGKSFFPDRPKILAWGHPL
jgi:hypothetical protein